MINQELINDIQTLHAKILGSSIDTGKAEIFANAIGAIRDASSFFDMYPKHAIGMALKENEFYGKLCYPCDVIELRKILDEGRITSLSRLVFVSNKLAERLIRSYKCLLILDADPEKLKNATTVGGLCIIDSCEMDISEKLVSIVANKKSPRKLIRSIVQDTKYSYPVYDSYFVPLLDVDKYASQTAEFVVNIPEMSIDNWTINASTNLEALGQALAKKMGTRQRQSFLHEQA